MIEKDGFTIATLVIDQSNRSPGLYSKDCIRLLNLRFIFGFYFWSSAFN